MTTLIILILVTAIECVLGYIAAQELRRQKDERRRTRTLERLYAEAELAAKQHSIMTVLRERERARRRRIWGEHVTHYFESADYHSLTYDRKTAP